MKKNELKEVAIAVGGTYVGAKSFTDMTVKEVADALTAGKTAPGSILQGLVTVLAKATGLPSSLLAIHVDDDNKWFLISDDFDDKNSGGPCLGYYLDQLETIIVSTSDGRTLAKAKTGDNYHRSY
jgi:hypothetical protein